MVAYRVIASLDIMTAYYPAHIGPVDGGLPQMFNGTVPFMMSIPAAGGINPVLGTLTVAQG
jgi:hypothetical protein